MKNKKRLAISSRIMSHLTIMTIFQKIKYLFVEPPPKPKRKYTRRKPAARVRNKTSERIESMRFSVPALRVGVLEYAPGQLQTGNSELDKKTVRLYYPPEAVSGKAFLRSLETAPVIVGGHDSTTNEQNKKIDGWASVVRYDTAQEAAIINGVVKGNKEIAFIKNNIGIDDFGASAFIDIYGLKVEKGVTSNGQEYDAIATDLKATHVALAKHVRDPENKLKVINAVVINSLGAIKQEGIKMEGLTPEQVTAIVENAVSKAVSAKNDSDRLEKLEKTVSSLANTVQTLVKNQEEEAKKEEEEKEAEAENEDEEKEEEEKEATLENAKPAQAIVAAFATAYNIDFKSKTPNFKMLASLAGIKEEDAAQRITAVNAKFEEISRKATAENKNETKIGGVF